MKPLCRCASHNRQDIGGDVVEIVVTVPPHIRQYMDGKQSVCLDLCISHIVLLLWASEIPTLGSCCGHRGSLPRSIVVREQDAETARDIIGFLGDDADVMYWSGNALIRIPCADLSAAREAAARREGYAKGMRDALAVACSLGYGGSPDVDRGHQEACDAIHAALAAWEVVAMKGAEPPKKKLDSL